MVPTYLITLTGPLLSIALLIAGIGLVRLTPGAGPWGSGGRSWLGRTSK